MDKKHEEEILEMAAKDEIHPLQDNDSFIAGCKQCGKCCRNRNDIILNAFDVFHISQATGKTLQEVINKYGEAYIGESSGLPLVLLKYRKDSFDTGTTCYFLGKKDDKYYCRINDKKPFVCKTYPLERLTIFEKMENVDAFEPIYHAQVHYREYDCIGIEEAIRTNESHTVLEWVGGKEKKALADTFWRIYTKFLYELDNIVDLPAFVEHRDQELVHSVMNHFFNKYYLDYDPNGTEEEFLEQYQINTENILHMFRELVKQFPKYTKNKK